MTQMQFVKATKTQSKLRLALFGPSGAGKTFTALRIASGLGGKIAFIDTESGSASKYADRFDFDALDLGLKTIEVYTKAIKAAQDAGYEVLIIDSLSHAWKELLAEVDRLAATSFKGNSWGAWSKGTPKQNAFIETILSFDGHVISTMRSKTEWDTVADPKTGKKKPVRIGLAPEQGKGIEYEFDMLIELSTDHVAQVLKDRTGKYQDAVIEMPGEDLGKELAAWLSEGVEPSERRTKVEYRELVNRIGIDDQEALAVLEGLGYDYSKAFAHLDKEYAEILAGAGLPILPPSDSGDLL